MPCYESNLVSVEIKTADHDLLKQALEALNLEYSYDNGVLTVYTPSGNITISKQTAQLNSNSQLWLNKIKQMYSIKTIEHLAKKYKCTVVHHGNNEFTLRRY